MAFCSGCGLQVNDQKVRFCSRCGAPAPQATLTTASHVSPSRVHQPRSTSASPAVPDGLQEGQQGPKAVDNSRAWLLASAPLLSVLLDAALLFGGYAEAAVVSTLIAVSVNVAVSVWDSRYVKSKGYKVSSGLAAFLVPGYLWQRSRVTGQGQALLATWIAVFIVSLAGSSVIGSRFAILDMGSVQINLQAFVDKQSSTTSMVSCPEKAVHAVNSTFICDVSDSTGSAHMQVTVQDSTGAITYQLIG